jgi:hypothetical protein
VSLMRARPRGLQTGESALLSARSRPKEQAEPLLRHCVQGLRETYHTPGIGSAPTAVAAPAHPRLVPAPTVPAAAVPAAAVPAAKAPAVPSSMPAPTPGPAGWARGPAVKAGGSPGKTPTTELRYRRRPSESRHAAGDIAAMPPGGSDCCEGQDRRTDKEREGGRREDDDRRRHCNSDGRRRQNHDRRRHCRAEQRAGRRRRWDRCRGRSSSHRRRWNYREGRRGYCRKGDNDRRRGNIDRRRRDNKGWSEDHAERGAD